MTDIEMTGYRATVAARAGTQFVPVPDRTRAEYRLRTDWGSYADTRGVQVDLVEYDTDGESVAFTPTELTLDAAEQFAQDLLAAVAARRAHPPTAADEILAAYVAFLDERGGYWGSTWAPLADLRERLAGLLPRDMVDATVAEMFEVRDVTLDQTVTDPDEEAGGVEVDGRYYTRLRPAHLFRKES
jgi:hypothetical protein